MSESLSKHHEELAYTTTTDDLLLEGVVMRRAAEDPLQFWRFTATVSRALHVSTSRRSSPPPRTWSNALSPTPTMPTPVLNPKSLGC